MSAENLEPLREQMSMTKISKSEKDASLSTIASTSEDSEPIALQVGERRFTTFRSTLTEDSPFFAALLSPEWKRAQSDGSYFVDADGSLFVYILRYLRTGTLPLFYSSTTGHDYGMYAALQAEARYFQIKRLTDWLKNKEYEKAVKIEYFTKEIDGPPLGKVCCSDEQLEYHPTFTNRKVYVCPRGLTVHRGNPTACGRACAKVQGEADDEYEEEEVVKTMIVSKVTTLSSRLCLAG